MRQTQPHPEGPFQSFVQAFYLAQWLIQFIALTCMVWLRLDLGYRMVSFSRIVPITIFLFVLSVGASNGIPADRLWGLLIFAVITLALGICQRVARWFELGKNVRRHSYYLGTSVLRRLKFLPESLRHARRVERFVDPVIVVAAGLLIFQISRPLGAWLIFSGLALRAYEFRIHQRDLHRTLDALDGLIYSEQQSEAVEEFEATSGWRRNENSNGLPTGLDEGIESQVTISVKQRRRNNKNNKTNPIDI